MPLLRVQQTNMEHCEYEKVRALYTKDESDSTHWKFFFRQLLVCSVPFVGCFALGLCYGGPTVYIPQIRKEANSTEVISETMGSLLMTIYSYAAIPWVIILPISAAHFGRKWPFVFVNVTFVVGTVTFYTSHSITQLLIGEAFESVTASTILTISTMVMTEYTSSEFRGFFLTFKSATFVWGIWVANTIGMFFHWKIIGLVKVILSLYPVTAVFFWPESPLWLANKGQFSKCAKAHRWLKGSSKKSEQELERLLSNQREVAGMPKLTLKVIKQKPFYKGVLLGICSLSTYTFSGKIACGFYSLVIIKKMTSSESTAYTGMLILDGVTVFAMYTGTILAKFLDRRTLFFYTSYIGIVTLFVLSLYVYLVSISVLLENMYVSIILLSIYTLSIGCGPALLATSLFAELLPIKSRSLAMFFVSIPEFVILGGVTQLTPIVMRKFGLHIAFLCFGISSSILILILYIYLPETKDKSLDEIENAILGKDKNVEEETQLNQDVRNI